MIIHQDKPCTRKQDSSNRVVGVRMREKDRNTARYGNEATVIDSIVLDPV